MTGKPIEEQSNEQGEQVKNEQQEKFPVMPEELIKTDETDEPKPEKESAKNSK